MGQTSSSASSTVEVIENNYQQQQSLLLAGDPSLDHEMHLMPSMYDNLPESMAVAMKMNEQRHYGRVDDLNSLPPIDLKALGGLWYSRINTTSCFQPACMNNVTAQYELDYTHDRIHLINSGTCCGICLCQARGIAVPSPSNVHGMDLVHGPRDYHVLFCINDDWSVRACARNCAPVGGLQLLHAGYMSTPGGTLNIPESRPPGMVYSSGPYDYLIVGNRERTQAWLLVRRPDQPSPFDADEAEDNEAGRFTSYLHRAFSYSQSLYHNLQRTYHTNPVAHEGHGYVRCVCP